MSAFYPFHCGKSEKEKKKPENHKEQNKPIISELKCSLMMK